MSDEGDEILCEITLGREGKEIRVKIPLIITSNINAAELTHRIIKLHGIPINNTEELVEKLRDFVDKKKDEYSRRESQKAVDAFRNGSVTLEQISAYWTSKFPPQRTWMDYQRDEVTWAEIYHSVVHSPAGEQLVHLEHLYARAMSCLVGQQEAALSDLSARQTQEMTDAVNSVGTHLSDADVNRLSARHLEDAQLAQVQWDSAVTALREEQRREFRIYVAALYEGKEVAVPAGSKRALEEDTTDSDSVMVSAEPTLEESFTIHLGTQKKQMHNLRLLSADALQLCMYQTHDFRDTPPQRLQTAMSLYSSNLNGFVLLVDDRINSFTGIKRDFHRLCSRSTELHFPPLADQLEAVREQVQAAVKWRQERPRRPQYHARDDELLCHVSQHLKSGDFYLSRHSNLADVHVVFHMVTDDETLRSGDINSRHPVILGLRNVLKMSCLHDITTLTVPLLLAHTMTEDMTMSWCQKRAELVYKCVKGFMMETSSWGGADMKNVQFLVPKGISEDLFQVLANMLPSIFRISNPLVVNSS